MDQSATSISPTCGSGKDTFRHRKKLAIVPEKYKPPICLASLLDGVPPDGRRDDDMGQVTGNKMRGLALANSEASRAAAWNVVLEPPTFYHGHEHEFCLRYRFLMV